MASFDPESLSILAYVKFGGLPVNVRSDFNIVQAPEGCVPYVLHGINATNGIRQIFEYLRKENYGIEYHLDSEELVRLNALLRFVETELLPAVHHLWFVNEQNFSRETRKAYCEAVGFPASLVMGWRLRNCALKRLRNATLLTDPMTDEQFKKQLYDQAKMAITTLSYLLGNNQYFVGDKPTSADAVIFGHLLPLLKAPLPDKPLEQHLRQCDNLARFCFRIHARFFAEIPTQPTSNLNNALIEETDLDSAFSFKGIRNGLLFAAAATLLSTAFAYNYGIIEIRRPDAAEDDNEELVFTE